MSGLPGYDKKVQVAKGDFAAQMRQALENVKATLEYAGSSIDKIARVNIYLDSRADIGEINAIYREFFGDDSGTVAGAHYDRSAAATQRVSDRDRLRGRSVNCGQFGGNALVQRTRAAPQTLSITSHYANSRSAERSSAAYL